MKQYLVSDDIIKAMARYLQDRPYKEVAQLISLLDSCPEVKIKENAEEVQEELVSEEA